MGVILGGGNLLPAPSVRIGGGRVQLNTSNNCYISIYNLVKVSGKYSEFMCGLPGQAGTALNSNHIYLV